MNYCHKTKRIRLYFQQQLNKGKKKKKGLVAAGGMKSKMKDDLSDYGEFDGGYAQDYEDFMWRDTNPISVSQTTPCSLCRTLYIGDRVAFSRVPLSVPIPPPLCSTQPPQSMTYDLFYCPEPSNDNHPYVARRQPHTNSILKRSVEWFDEERLISTGLFLLVRNSFNDSSKLTDQ